MSRHDIAEILLQLALNTNQSINQSINTQTTNVWRLTIYLLYLITMKYNYIEYQSFKYWCIFFYLVVICTTIKSHQSNQTRSTTWRTCLGCKYSSYCLWFCNLQYIYMYSLSRL